MLECFLGVDGNIAGEVIQPFHQVYSTKREFDEFPLSKKLGFECPSFFIGSLSTLIIFDSLVHRVPRGLDLDAHYRLLRVHHQ